ncbi:MDR family MFS transporter [Brevibacillus sp. H7]|uniref:MDR family MFS transporter n=1 Tax=Brevibacillus sp. H7 TaxID=3349138 RepID=UPI0038103921
MTNRNTLPGKSETSVRWVMVALMLGMLLGALDMTIVSTAMPQIIAELGGLTYYSWVFSAYMLTSTIFVPLFGKLSDLFGRRLIYQIGLGLFMLGSALCGFSTTIVELIVYRALQGVGAAALMPIAIVIVGDLYPPEQRGKIQGVFGAVFGLASVAGPALGGFITDYLSWEWTFWINLPFGLAAMAVIAYALKESKGEGKRYVDYTGAALLMGGMTALLLGLIMGGVEYPWNSWQIYGLFAASVIMTGLFLFVQTKVPEPLLPLTLFQNRIVSVSAVLGFLLGAAMFAAVSYIPLYVQGVIGVSASLAGYILTPLMLSMIASSIISGRMITKVSYRAIVLYGMIVMSASFYLLSLVQVDTPMWQVIVCMVMIGLGMGPMNPVLNIAVQSTVDAATRGIATSSLAFFRSIGGTVGVTVMGVFLNHELSAQLQKVVAHVPPQLASQLEKFTDPQLLLNQDVRGQIPQELLVLLQQALTVSINHVFLVALAITAIGIIVALFYGNAKMTKREMPPAGNPQVNPQPANSRS